MLQHGAWVRALAIHLVQDPANADEVEQQSWLQALENPPRHASNLKSWWSSVVRNVAARRWRDQARTLSVAPEAVEAYLPNEATPEAVAERVETFRLLAEALTRLQDPYRTALFLRFFEELPVKEIAARLSVPPSTAQSHIHRGLERMRAMLGQDLGDAWKSRCQAFAIPMADGGSWLASMTAAALSPLPLVAALLMAVGLVLWSPWQPEPEPETEIHMQARVPSGAAESAGLPSDSVAIERSSLSAPPPPDSGFAPVPEQGALVTVVDSTTGDPLPGAEVIYLDLARFPIPLEGIQEFARWGGDSFFAMLGDRYRCDADGQVLLPQPQGRLALVLRTRNHFTLVDRASLVEDVVEGKELVLAAQQVEVLPVQVVGAAGRGLAGADVMFRADRDRDNGDLQRTLTDVDGMAYLKVTPYAKSMLAGTSTHAYLLIAGLDPIRAGFDLQDLPQDPVRLVMPEVGSVEILAQGHEAGQRLFAGISPLVETSDPDRPWRSEGEGLTRRMENGRLFLPYVGLGEYLRISMGVADMSERVEIERWGPQVAGESVKVTLRLEDPYPSVEGRILNTEGKVAKNIGMELEFRSLDGGALQVRRFEIRTDREGFFRSVIYSEGLQGQPCTMMVRMPATRRKAARVALLELPQGLRPGVNELGDFIVDTPPVLMAGRVVDHEGLPVADADVEVALEEHEEDHISIPVNRSSGVSFVSATAADVPGGPSWYPLNDLSVTTDANGRFEVRDIPFDRSYRVEVDHRAHQPAGTIAHPGDGELEFRLDPKVTYRGKVLLDRNIPNHGVHVGLFRDSEDTGEIEWRSGLGFLRSKEGEYSFTLAEAERVGVAIRSLYRNEIIHVIEPQDPVVRNWEVELPTIDLRGQLHRISVWVVDEKGQAILNGDIHGDTRSSGWHEFQPLIMVSKSPTFSFDVSAYGRRLKEVRNVREDQTVVLPPGLAVSLKVDDLGERWSDHRIRLDWTRVDAPQTPTWDRSWSCTLQPGEPNELRLPSPGRYRARVFVSETASQEGWQPMVEMDPAGAEWILDVLDREGLQAYTLPITASHLEAALAGS